METIEYKFIDKSNWPTGQWNNEPDKVQWRDEHTGLPCLARRARNGIWCGYVGVSESHPWFGQPYQDHDDLDVHGGLTFSDSCAADGKEHGICHKPAEGEPDKVWWFGFDCAHVYDLIPEMLRHYPRIPDETYKSIDYVRSECAKLARQIADAA